MNISFGSIPPTMTRGFWARAALAVLGVLAMGVGPSAVADNLYLGGYNTTPIDIIFNGANKTAKAGNFDPNTTLNGVSLPYVYCVDLTRTVNVPATYGSTGVTSDGTIHGSVVNNAAQVAYLVTTYAAAANSDVNKQAGLQAAIWETIYGSLFTLNSSNTALNAAFNTYTTGVGTAPISALKWLSVSSNGTDQRQGLVGYVPIPAAVWLFGSALAGLTLVGRRARLGLTA